MARFAVRISRFADRRAFERCVQLLVRLRPELTAEICETALAKLPATVSHDADEVAATALAEALQKLGAKVALLPAAGDDYGSTQELSPEIDLSFLDAARKSKPGAAAAGASKPRPGDPIDGKAPWES